jgi:hypothetical protein
MFRYKGRCCVEQATGGRAQSRSWHSRGTADSALHIFGNCVTTQIEMRERFAELVTPFLKRVEL